MVNFTRRLLPILFSGLLLVPLASTVAAEDVPPPPADDAALMQDGVDLVHMTNAKRENQGLVDLRIDPVLMSIKRVTVRWSGADTRLQVLTSGLRYFQAQWRAVGGSWHAWTTSTATRKSITLTRGVRYEVRVRSRDHAGNWGAWRTISLRP